MSKDDLEKRVVGERCRTAPEAAFSIKRRSADAVENVTRLERLGLSRRIAVIVSARQYGLTEEKLDETLRSKNN